MTLIQIVIASFWLTLGILLIAVTLSRMIDTWGDK